MVHHDPNCIKTRGQWEGGNEIAGEKLERKGRGRGERNERGVVGMAVNFGSLAKGTAQDKLGDEGAHSGPPVVMGEKDHGGVNTRMTVGRGTVDEGY